MSDLGSLGTAKGSLVVDSSGVETGVNRAISSLSALEPVVRDNWWGIRNLGLAFAGISASIAATFGVATKAAISWEDSLAGVQRTTYDATLSADQNARALATVEKQLRNLAAVKPTTPADLAKIAEEAGALGIATQDIAAFTSVIADLEATTDLTADEATKNLARIAGVLNVPPSEFDNLGSAILEIGRSTAATEPEIVNLARRLSGAGAVAGLTAAEVIGISAAVISLGPRAEAGASAVQKTIFDMARAAAEGGDKLNIFSRLAGVAPTEFARAVREDAAGAFVLFINGLGKITGDAVTTTGILDNLGITEVRQAQALAQLAAASINSSNENVQLGNAINRTSQAYNENITLNDIAARRYGTTAAKLQILRNTLFEVKLVFGNLLLPILKVAIVVLNAFIGGLAQLPTPARVAFIVVMAIVGSMAALAAVALLVVPRIVLVKGALLQLQVQAGLTAGALGATQLSLFGVGAAASGAGAVGLARFLTIGTKVAKLGGILAIALGIGAAAATVFGFKQNRAKIATDDLGGTMDDTTKLMQALQEESDATSEGYEDLAKNTDGAAKAERDHTKALQDARQATIERNRALLSLIDAEFSQRQATFALKDAQKAYDDALEAAQNPLRAVEKAEGELEASRRDQERAADSLRDAETKLATVRADQLDDLSDAQDKLIDTQFKYQDSLKRITKAEEALIKLQSGPTIDELRDATNKLANAQLNLVDAERSVIDAQFQLNYLREEGASQRDISDAELTLEKAQQKVLDTQDEVIDSTTDLDKVRSGASAEEIADAEREVQDAYRDSQHALRDIADAEKDVSKLRLEIAQDTAYKEALADLKAAQLSLKDAAIEVADQEKKLKEVRKDNGADILERAELDLEQAIYRQAQANTEVTKQMALSRGEMFSSADEARSLASELEKLSSAAPTEAITKRFERIADALRRAKDEGPEIDSGGGDGAAGGGLGGGSGLFKSPLLDDMFKGLNEKLQGVEEKGKQVSFNLGGILRTVVSTIAGIAVKGLVGAALAALGVSVGIPAALATAISVLLGIAASILVDKFLKTQFAADIGHGIWEGLKAAGKFFGSIPDLFNEWIIQPIRNFFRMHSPSELMSDLGVDIILGLINGIIASIPGLGPILLSMLPKMLGWLAGAGSWLLEKGGDIIWGLIDGMSGVAGDIWQFFWDLPGNIGKAIGNAATWLVTHGKNVIIGLLNGLGNQVGSVWKFFWDLPGNIGKTIGKAGEWLLNTGTDILIGLWNGMVAWAPKLYSLVKDLAKGVFNSVKDGLGWLMPGSPSELGLRIGEGLTLGINKSLKDTLPSVVKAAQNFSAEVQAATLSNIDPFAFSSLIDTPALTASRTATTAALGIAPVAAATPPQAGDTYNIEVAERATADEMLREAEWRKRVKRR